MDKNIIEYGISNLYIGTYTVDNGTGEVTMGKPYHLPGAVSLGLDSDSNENIFYADNIAYWTGYSSTGKSGELEVARFTDEFRQQFLGEIVLDDGGQAEISNPKKPKIYLAFESEGDAQKRRAIFYNGAFGAIKREYKTKEGEVKPDTEKIAISISGDSATGLVKAVYVPDATGYNTLFTNPPKPKLPADATV